MNKSKVFLALGLASAAFALPTGAHAQNVLPGNGFVGVSAGFHDLAIDEDDLDGLDIDTGSPIVGVFAGYDVPLGGRMFVGGEVNYTYGFDAIDSEYGIAARLGFRAPGGAKFYARGGYQHIDLDIDEIFDEDFEGAFDDIDDDGDYLLGLGVDLPLGKSLIRVNLDTVSFDTVRATAGVGLRF